LEETADFGEIGDHLGALGAVDEQGTQGGGDVGGGEVLLDQLRYDAAAGDEVDHSDGEIAVGVLLRRNLGGIADETFGEFEGEGRDTVDDDEGVSNDGGLYGCGTAGHDAGAGVVKGFAGIGDEVDCGGWLPIGRLTEKVSDPSAVEG
jgi:hypothetical protein